MYLIKQHSSRSQIRHRLMKLGLNPEFLFLGLACLVFKAQIDPIPKPNPNQLNGERTTLSVVILSAKFTGLGFSKETAFGNRAKQNGEEDIVQETEGKPEPEAETGIVYARLHSCSHRRHPRRRHDARSPSPRDFPSSPPRKNLR